MTVPVGSRRYRIILRGECGPLMAGVLDDALLPKVGAARVTAAAAATLGALGVPPAASVS